MRGQMLRFATTILKNTYDAEDVVSQVSERLWRERERLKGTTAASFAMTSVRNACYDMLRQRQRRGYELPDENIASGSAPPEMRDTIEMVRKAINTLPPVQREVIHLKDIEGYSTHEIATMLDKEESNIRVILSRSRTALKEIIIKNMKYEK